MPEQQFKRATAFKLRIGSLLQGKKVKKDEEKLNFVELGNKEIKRVNVVANIVEKFENEPKENKTRYASLTLDDASGQIQAKFFGDDVEKFKNIGQGDTVMVIGRLRIYQNNLYILPEIIKTKDPRYLLVRKLELESDKEEGKKENNKKEVKAVKEQIIDMIKKAEEQGGIETDKLVMEINAKPDIINQEIQKLLEEGLAYEPKPGKIRYLG